MKKKKAAENPVEQAADQSQEVEILKAVAQAWYSHSGNSKPTSEYDARRGNFYGHHRPSRFRIEAFSSSTSKKLSSGGNSSSWDFKKSLLDSYEIVTVSKKLEERGISLNGDDDGIGQGRRVKRESKSSLRNLLNLMSSSKRFTTSENTVSRVQDASQF
ncbi:hypothetical protein LINPERPRIM_LOCUS36651 [Linum perenne]